MNTIEQAMHRLAALQSAGIGVRFDGATVDAADGVGPVTGPARAHPAAPPLLPRVPIALREAARSAVQPTGEPASASKQVVIDLERLRANGFIVAGHGYLELCEQLRVVKRPLIACIDRHAADTRANLIMVASAVPGEGKTFFAINLALSLSHEVDRNVLLVDADVVRPTLGRTLGLRTSSTGLMDVLGRESRDLSDAIVQTNIPKLAVLPAGSPRPDSTELLASPAMGRLLDELATRYPDRIVVFDTPPLLATTQSRIVAGLVGQVVMVVDSTKTNQQTAAQAFALLERCQNVVAVLNKCRGHQASYRFGYYEG